MALNPKQLRFVREYLVDHNATQAAIRAGYSKQTAKAQGSRLLTHVDVSQGIQRGDSKVHEKLELTAEGVLADIKRISLLAEAREDLNVALKGRELLGKHLKLFTDKVEHSGNISIGVINPYAESDDA